MKMLALIIGFCLLFTEINGGDEIGGISSSQTSLSNPNVDGTRTRQHYIKKAKPDYSGSANSRIKSAKSESDLVVEKIDGADKIERVSESLTSLNQPKICGAQAPKHPSKKAKFESLESRIKRVDSQLDVAIKKNSGDDDVVANLNMLAPQIEELVTSARSFDYPKIYGIRARLESYKKEANGSKPLKSQIKALNKRLDLALKTAHSKYGDSKDQRIQTIESEFKGNDWRNDFDLKDKVYYLKETKSYLKTLQSIFGNRKQNQRIKTLKQQIYEAGQECLTLIRNQSLSDVLAYKREEPRIETLALMRQNFRVYQEMASFFKMHLDTHFSCTFYNFLDMQAMRLEKLNKGEDDDFVFMKAKVAKLDNEVKDLQKSGQCSHSTMKNHLKDFNEYQKYYDDRVEFLKAKSGEEDYRLQKDMQTLQADLSGIRQSIDACEILSPTFSSGRDQPTGSGSDQPTGSCSDKPTGSHRGEFTSCGSGNDPDFDRKMAARRAMKGNQ